MTDETERAKRRYRQLVVELGAEEGAPAHGWLTAVANRLGVNQGYLSRIHRREREGIGAELLDKAVAGLRIRRGYFYDLREPTSYKEYLGKEPVFQGWRDFIESPVGQDVTEQERQALAAFLIPDGGEPSAAFYEGVLHMMRGRISQAALDKGLPKASEISDRLKRNRDANNPLRGEQEDDSED